MQRYFLEKGKKFERVNQKSSLGGLASPCNFDIVQDIQGNHWRKYDLTVQGRDAEAELTKCVHWRGKTSMPVLKATSLSIQNSLFYPKKATLLIEHMPTDFRSLRNLSLEQCLYLIRECLVGFHTLIYKFGSVTVDAQNCGLNDKGECRVWKNANFSTCDPKIGQWDIVKIFKKLLDMMTNLITPEQVCQLNEIKNDPELRKVETYCSVHEHLQKHIRKRNLLVPQCIRQDPVDGERARRNEYHSGSKKCYMNYNSPNLPVNSSFDRGVMSNGTHSKRLAFLESASKPKIKLRSKHDNTLTLKKKEKSAKMINGFKSCSHINKKKSDYSIQNVFSINYEEEEVSIQEFTLRPKGLQIVKQYEFKVIPEKRAKAGEGKSKSKDSWSTATVSRCKKTQERMGSSPDYGEQGRGGQKMGIGKNVMSLMIESEIPDKKSQLKGQYDFGGLVPMEIERELDKKKDHEEENPLKERNAFSLNVSKLGEKNLQKLVYSIYFDKIHQRKDDEKSYENLIIKQNSWDRKFSGLLQSNQENLTQSICCGEQQDEGVRLEIQLSRLGKLGRQVAKSIIPDRS